MNDQQNNGSLASLLTGGKPFEVNIVLDTKSLVMLGTVIILAGLAIIYFKKLMN